MYSPFFGIIVNFCVARMWRISDAVIFQSLMRRMDRCGCDRCAGFSEGEELVAGAEARVDDVVEGEEMETVLMKTAALHCR